MTVVINELELEPAEAQPPAAGGPPAGSREPSPARLAGQLERLLEVRWARAARLRAD
jgi:hypothetical protein